MTKSVLLALELGGGVGISIAGYPIRTTLAELGYWVIFALRDPPENDGILSRTHADER
jgi:hypothetical protein